MLLRIRSPEGTNRIEVSDSATLHDLKVKILQTNKQIGEYVMALDPQGSILMLDDSLPLSSYRVSHGAMVYLIAESPTSSSSSSSSTPPPSASASSSSSQAATQQTTPTTTVIKCTHGPAAKCVYCIPSTSGSSSDNSSDSSSNKCRHGANTTCPNCQNKATGKKISWLCTHPKGAKCVNCMRQPRSSSSKKKTSSPCSHPPYMVCANCTSVESNDNTKGDSTNKTSRCQHGPNAACANCRPALPSDDNSSSFKCKNHGPNGSCIECIERLDRRKLRLKLQDTPHCSSSIVDLRAANTFQVYIQQQKFKEQRIGILYGKLNDDKSVTIEAIYEPPQSSSSSSSFSTLTEPDPDEDRVDSIASLLGLSRVGWIYSHPAREYVMSFYEISRAAYYQNKYGSHFVTLILSVNQKGESNLEAFQVSDQAMSLQLSDQLINISSPSLDSSPDKVKFKTPVYVEGAETLISDYHFFLVTVPVKGSDKPMFSCEFPVENRKQQPQSASDLKIHLINNAKKSFIDQISDFHLLIFLSKGYFDLTTDMPSLCDAVRTKKASNTEGFKMILDSYVQ